MQERRLRELRGQALAKRAVEHRIARGIREIGKQIEPWPVSFGPRCVKKYPPAASATTIAAAAAMSGQRPRGAMFAAARLPPRRKRRMARLRLLWLTLPFPLPPADLW